MKLYPTFEVNATYQSLNSRTMHRFGGCIKFVVDIRKISVVLVLQNHSDLSDIQKLMFVVFRAQGGRISETTEFVNFK